MKALARIFLLAIALVIGYGTAFCADKDNADGSSADDVTTFYAELSGSLNPVNGQMQVVVNMGKMLSGRVGLSPADLKKANSEMHFSSMTDAMNALSQNGWRLVDTYTISVRSQTTLKWVIAKDVADPMELLDGFLH